MPWWLHAGYQILLWIRHSNTQWLNWWFYKTNLVQLAHIRYIIAYAKVLNCFGLKLLWMVWIDTSRLLRSILQTTLKMATAKISPILDETHCWWGWLRKIYLRYHRTWTVWLANMYRYKQTRDASVQFVILSQFEYHGQNQKTLFDGFGDKAFIFAYNFAHF